MSSSSRCASPCHDSPATSRAPRPQCTPRPPPQGPGLGRRLRPEQLIASLDTVASISDLYDERLVAKYGGETALERLRSTAKRHRRAVVSAQNN